MEGPCTRRLQRDPASGVGIQAQLDESADGFRACRQISLIPTELVDCFNHWALRPNVNRLTVDRWAAF